MIKNYRDLEVWQNARVLVKEVYLLTSRFPKDELYGLTSQLRRAVISIPSNIAEGHSRNSTKDYINYISIAIGSLAEVDTQLILAQDLGYLVSQDWVQVNDSIQLLQKMLHSLRAALRAKEQ